MGVADTFKFFKEVAKDDDTPLGPELAEMFATWKDEDGLIPNAACPGLFKITQQAWSKMPGRYALTEYEFLNKKWYSRREIEALHKLKRHTGGKGKVVAAMVRDCLDDARTD